MALTRDLAHVEHLGFCRVESCVALLHTSIGFTG
jgi:hypothetical protein